MTIQHSMTVATGGRGTTELTREIQEIVRNSGIERGICHVFVHHTSASLMICENADPTVRMDLERFMARIAPDGDPQWQHNDEGADDMPAHIRSVITQPCLSIPVSGGRCTLGTWQGVYLWEHRRHGHQRRLTVTVQGLEGSGGG